MAKFTISNASTPVWGATLKNVLCAFARRFQSTLPCGERPFPAHSSAHSKHFNPRSRVGSDCAQALYWDKKGDFNPRSRVGSDVKNTVSMVLALTFQSTLPCGERRVFL